MPILYTVFLGLINELILTFCDLVAVPCTISGGGPQASSYLVTSVSGASAMVMLTSATLILRYFGGNTPVLTLLRTMS